jgi:hypothetical protein
MSSNEEYNPLLATLRQYPALIEFLDKESKRPLEEIHRLHFMPETRILMQEEVGWSGRREYAHTGYVGLRVTWNDGRSTIYDISGMVFYRKEPEIPS